MPATKLVAMWTPDQRLQVANELYAALCEAQKRICSDVCGGKHCRECDEINAVLLNADPVLQEWGEE